MLNVPVTCWTTELATLLRNTYGMEPNREQVNRCHGHTSD
jgi:hypothetical protein